MSTFSQKSFSGGELSPALYARVDTIKYTTGARTIRNFMIMRHGGLANRPGTEFVAEVNDSSLTARLIPFAFNNDQTYALEFGNFYMRVIRDGAVLTDSTKSITGITKANPAVVTCTSHGFSDGDEIYISGVSGMTQVNNRNFKIAYIGANSFSLVEMDGTTGLNSTSYSTYTSGGTADHIYTIASPFSEEDLPTVQFVQSADVITFAHQNYAPRELSRTGHTSWSFSTVSFTPSISAPSSPSATQNGTTGSTAYSYKITSIASDTFEESLASSAANVSNGNATLSVTNNISISWTLASGAVEYNVYKSMNGVYGFIGTAIGTSFVDNGIPADTTITPPDARDPFSLEATTNISGITQASTAVVTSSSHGLITGDVVYIASVSGMTEVNSQYYKVVVLTSSTFELYTMQSIAVDSTGFTAYTSGGTVAAARNFPATVSYFQQRKMFSNTKNNPERVWGSRTGQYTNFTISSPLQDDDAVTFDLVGRQVNEGRHIVDLGKLLLFTSGGEWAAQGDAAGILKPTDINAKQYSYNGAETLPPIIIGESALYLQARGTIVRDLGYDYQVDGYRGNDLTIFSAHLFDNFSLNDWTYQKVPNSIVWATRSDGALLGLTYVREHQVFGWHRHDFDGYAENVCSIPEGNEDSLYLIVQRDIDGRSVRYIERMATRRVDDIVDCNYTDCSLAYDGRNTGSRTMTLSGSGWTYTDTLTLTSSTSFFTSGDVGNAIHLTGSDGDMIRFTITGYTSGTVVTGRPHKTVPTSLQATAVTDWSRAVDEITGLWHLEGKDVSVFADGFVVASPHNEAYVTITVENGSISLDKPYGVIKVGLPITSDVYTLDIDTSQGETLADKKQLIGKLTLFVESSRGIWVGAKPPTDDSTDPLEGLSELKIRNSESYDEPVDLATGKVDVLIRPEWNSNGRIFIRQVDPIPLSVLSVAPAGYIPLGR